MPRETLSTSEIEEVLLRAATANKWGLRNRLLLLMTHCAGARVVDLANLRIRDVLALSGEIYDSITPSSGRNLHLTQQLRQEMAAYIQKQFDLSSLAGAAYAIGSLPLFYTQRRKPFSPTTLSQTFTTLYSQANVDATARSGRRTWLSRLYSKAAELRAFELLCGRRRFRSELRRSDVSPELLSAAVEHAAISGLQGVGAAAVDVWAD